VLPYPRAVEAELGELRPLRGGRFPRQARRPWWFRKKATRKNEAPGEHMGVVHSRSDSERVSFFVLVEHWRGEIRNMEPHKCDDLAWFEPNALPPNIVPVVRRALENFLAGRFYDSMGWDDPA
jgi:hypothetical protein